MNGISMNSRLLVAGGILLGLLGMLGAAAYFGGGKLYERLNAPAARQAMPGGSGASADGSGMGGPVMAAEGDLTPEQAEKLMQLMQEIQTNPNNTEALVDIAELFLETENQPMAEAFLQRAIMTRPGDTYPRYMLGVLLSRQGKPAQAATVFEGLLAIREEPAAMYNLALLYKYHLNRREQAQELLRKALGMPDLDEDLAGRLRAEMQ